MTDRIDTVDCPKCSGKGHINAFSHYADGVCFCCKGTGTVKVNRDAKVRELSTETRKLAEFVLASTAETWEGLSYARLNRARTFCHGGFGLQDAYPELLAHWQEVGDPAFFAAQERKLEAFYANR